MCSSKERIIPQRAFRTLPLGLLPQALTHLLRTTVCQDLRRSERLVVQPSPHTHVHTYAHTNTRRTQMGNVRLGEEKENDAKHAQWSSRLKSQISGLLQQFSLCPGLAASLSCQLCKQAQAAMIQCTPVHPVLSSLARAQPTIREDPSLYMST